MTRLWPDTITVECDGCGETIDIPTAELSYGGVMLDDDALAEAGWTFDCYDYCPSCKEDPCPN